MRLLARAAALQLLARTAALQLLAVVLLGSCAAHPPLHNAETRPAPSTADSGQQPWSKATLGMTRADGMFATYRKRDAVFLAVRPGQLGREFLLISSFARGIGQNGLFGGLPVADQLLAFERSGDHLLLRSRNSRFRAPAGTPMARAMELSIGHSVLASLAIVSTEPDSGAMLVDATPLLVSDATDMAQTVAASLGRPVRFDPERSALTSVTVFPRNLEAEALLTFNPADRQGLSLDAVPDERFIPISVHYSFCALPEVPMTPRLADDRVGYILTAFKDFGRDTTQDFWVRYVTRWRLEKRDSTAALSPPIAPIVFYVDRTVPLAYRAYVKRGIENWNHAFAAAGFDHAIVAREAPDDSSWDAEDARYSTVRWITTSTTSFNAVGPSRVDPRTGEILDADVLIDDAAVQGYRNWWRRWAGPVGDADLADAVTPRLAPIAAAGAGAGRWCSDQSAADEQGALLRTSLLMNGTIAPGDAVPDTFVAAMVVRLVMHEVGHTLGLRHNFKSSIATPYDRLTDHAWTRSHGLMGSVMDYVTPNIAPDSATTVESMISSVGPYDDWAIRFGYTPSGSRDPVSDAAFARRIADESAAPGHEYGDDDDAYPPDAMDPLTNLYDLGSDPLRFARERSAYIARLWRDPRFEARILGDRGEFPMLRRAFDALLQQYALAVGFAVKYVGGQYVERDHRGQPGAREPLTPVPAGRQREALELLARRVFDPGAFDVAPTLLARLGPDRWVHWGMPDPFAGGVRLDYDLGDRLLGLQRAVLDALLSPNRLQRLREAESRSPDAFRVSELFANLTAVIWGGASTTPSALGATDTRRALQRVYVDRLAAMVVGAVPGVPDDARALARLQLTRIDTIAAAAQRSRGLGDEGAAHLAETRARTARALNAERPREH